MRPLGTVAVLLTVVLLAPSCEQARTSASDVPVPGVVETGEERPLADLRQRAVGGDADAQVVLGGLYESGQGVAADPATAAAWYRKAAERGEAVAQFSLGSIYEAGADGVPRDDARAAMWYEKAAAQELGMAQYRLGVLYRDGRGVRRDRAEAVTWLRKAADRGEADAQIDLGILLTSRQATPGDIVEAHAWLNLAASRWKDEGQRIRAASLRDALDSAMTPAQRSEAYRRAAEWQDAHAWRK